MIKQIITSIGCIFIILTSCTKITSKDVTIIDGIRLGTTEDGFNRQCDSLKNQQVLFYTKSVFSRLLSSLDNRPENLDEYRIKGYVTNIFNSSYYNGGSPTLQHYGLFSLINGNGTENIVGLNVLLGYMLTTKNDDLPLFSQNMSCIQIESIARMLTEKYGKPDTILKNQNLTFHVLEKNKILSYSSDTSSFGEMLIWKTKYLDIKFFKGIASGNNIYNLERHSYTSYLDYNVKRIITNVEYEEGKRPCYSYSYICYMLNDLAIKELELDKVKL